ncbi:MAG TPA: BON domain-containing protein [Burkholderiales bacterium]|nr:BON domain-containing protein [Burkholderiales bacterium]
MTRTASGGWSLFLALTAALLFLAACGSGAPAPKSIAAAPKPVPPVSAPDTGANPAAAAASKPMKPDPDSLLAAAVKKALASDQNLAGQNIDVTATSGTAHLWGTVDRAEDRSRAARIAASVAGVNNVDNKLAVVKGS